MKPIYLVVLFVLAVASSLYYRGEEIAARKDCQETVAAINRLSAESKRISDEVVRNEETIRVSQAQTESARVSDIHKRREVAKRVQPVNSAADCMRSCRLSDVTVGLLWESASDTRLSTTGDTTLHTSAQDSAP